MRKILTSLASLAISVIVLFLVPNWAFSKDIKGIDRIPIDPSVKFQTTPKSFAVSEDYLFFFPDYKDGKGTIKVLSKGKQSLHLVTELSHLPNNERLIQPWYLTYMPDTTPYEGILGIIDYGTKKVAIFKRSGKMEFVPMPTISCPSLGYDLKFAGSSLNQIIISGYVTDPQDTPFDLFSINIDNRNINYLISSCQKYNLRNQQEMIQKYDVEGIIPSIGITGFTDICEDELFYVWEGKFRVIQMNLKSMKISRTFGHPVLEEWRSNKYITEIRDLRKLGDKDAYLNAKKRIPRILNIFATKDLVFLVYQEAITAEIKMQRYNRQGDYMGEFLIPEKLGKAMWFDKETYELYAISSPDTSGRFSILKYKIER